MDERNPFRAPVQKSWNDLIRQRNTNRPCGFMPMVSNWCHMRISSIHSRGTLQTGEVLFVPFDSTQKGGPLKKDTPASAYLFSCFGSNILMSQPWEIHLLPPKRTPMPGPFAGFPLPTNLGGDSCPPALEKGTPAFSPFRRSRFGVFEGSVSVSTDGSVSSES